MNKVIFVILAVVVGLLFVEIAASSLDDATTDTVTQATSVTAVGTAGTLVLENQNYYTDRTNMTITGATDGALNTASSTVDATRLDLTFASGSLATGSTQVITVVHRTEDSDDQAVGIIQIVPFLFVMGIMTSTVFGAFQGVKAARGQGGGLNITEFIIVLVGLILIGTLTTFVDSTTNTFAVRPEYVGVGAVLPLVTIGYVIGLVTQLVGTGIGAAKSRGGF